MPLYSATSLKILHTCCPELQTLFMNVIHYTDVKILSGYRGEEEQNRLFAEGASKVMFPNSKHNKYPSKAVDWAPYPIDWKDTGRFIFVAGRITQLAAQLNIRIRWGGDWNMNGRQTDEHFRDIGHIEILRGE